MNEQRVYFRKEAEGDGEKEGKGERRVEEVEWQESGESWKRWEKSEEAATKGLLTKAVTKELKS